MEVNPLEKDCKGLRCAHEIGMGIRLSNLNFMPWNSEEKKLGELHFGDILPCEWNWKLSPKEYLKMEFSKSQLYWSKKRNHSKTNHTRPDKNGPFWIFRSNFPFEKNKRCYFVEPQQFSSSKTCGSSKRVGLAFNGSPCVVSQGY